MTLSQPVKLFLGALGLLPIIYMIFFFVSIGSSVGSRNGAPDDFELLFRLHLATMALIFAQLIFYIIYLFRTQRVPQGKKALWAVVLFMGNMIAIPIFWFLYVWCEPSSEVDRVDL